MDEAGQESVLYKRSFMSSLKHSNNRSKAFHCDKLGLAVNVLRISLQRYRYVTQHAGHICARTLKVQDARGRRAVAEILWQHCPSTFHGKGVVKSSVRFQSGLSTLSELKSFRCTATCERGTNIYIRQSWSSVMTEKVRSRS